MLECICNVHELHNVQCDRENWELTKANHQRFESEILGKIKKYYDLESEKSVQSQLKLKLKKKNFNGVSYFWLALHREISATKLISNHLLLLLKHASYKLKSKLA